MMMAQSVHIDTEYITLGQFLKMTDCIGSGGQAKSFLQETNTYINGEKEQRRGKKLYAGTVILVEGIGEFNIVAS